MNYQIQSTLNKQTLKLYYGLVGKNTSIFGFSSIRKAREFLVILNKKINETSLAKRPKMEEQKNRTK